MEGPPVGKPPKETDCSRLLNRAGDVEQRLGEHVSHLRKVTARLYSQPPAEEPKRQARGEGWIEDMDGVLDAIDILIVDFGAELEQLCRFAE